MKKASSKTTPAAEFKAFQAAHPETRYVDAILTDLNHNFPLVGKFNGIAHKVNQYLTEAGRIASTTTVVLTRSLGRRCLCLSRNTRSRSPTGQRAKRMPRSTQSCARNTT